MVDVKLYKEARIRSIFVFIIAWSEAMDATFCGKQVKFIITALMTEVLLLDAVVRSLGGRFKIGGAPEEEITRSSCLHHVMCETSPLSIKMNQVQYSTCLILAGEGEY